LNSKTVSEKGRFFNLNVIAVQMKLSDVKKLSEFKEVAYVSVDRDVQMHGHVETTSGAAAMRALSSGNSGLHGTGIGIAVLDSGINAGHISFANSTNKIRVVASVNFTGQGTTGTDPYGHGTHVSALVAGASTDDLLRPTSELRPMPI
jgi:serine protease AprX